MNVLAGLLPGLRQLRAPLAAGYLWLAVGWLGWGDRLPESKPAQQTTAEAIRRAWIDATPFGRAVALSFVAYLLGVISVELLGRLAYASPIKSFPLTRQISYPSIFFPLAFSLSSPIIVPYTRSSRLIMSVAKVWWKLANLRWKDVGRCGLVSASAIQDLGFWIARWREANSHAVPQGYYLRSLLGEVRSEMRNTRNSSDRLVLNRFIRGGSTETVKDREARDLRVTHAIGADLVSELPQLRLNLLKEAQQLYTEIDRAKGEAEFRTAVSPPLLGVMIVAVVAWNGFGWWIALGVIPVLATIVLWVTAGAKMRESNDAVLRALMADTVKSPMLEEASDRVEGKQETQTAEVATAPAKQGATNKAEVGVGGRLAAAATRGRSSKPSASKGAATTSSKPTSARGRTQRNAAAGNPKGAVQASAKAAPGDRP